jgi:signal transduction histidine kinase
MYFAGSESADLIWRRIAEPGTSTMKKWSKRAGRSAWAFRLIFAIPAGLLAVYATVISVQLVAWQLAGFFWVLTLLAIGLVARMAAIIERCEHDAFEGAGLCSVPRAPWSATDSARTASARERRLAHLEQVVVRQHRFVSDAAHELRTPLTAQSLVGENVLASSGASSDDVREAVVSMLEESKHMRRLIEGLLDLTRASLSRLAEPGSTRLPMLDLSAMSLHCVESLRVLAEEEQQTIRVHLSPPLRVDADSTMVRQALLNVIHNAIEHCPPSTHIEVRTRLGPTREAQIIVQDNGPGIPAQQRSRVFERFYRGAGASRQRSLGLGLSIAKAILCSQGGGIELRSMPTTGCCFILSLPLPLSVPAPTAAHDESSVRKLFRRIRHRRIGDRSAWVAERLERRSR